jgi:exopolysaccharide biosynthesis polyprenyl glycosylphosphotransferase
MSSTSFTGTAPLGRVIPFPAYGEARTASLAEGVRRFELAAAALERTLDVCAVVVAVLLAYAISGWWRGAAQYSAESTTLAALGFGVLMVLLLEKRGDYRPCLSLLAVRETERLLRATLTGFLLGLPLLVALTRSVPRTTVGFAALLVPLALAVEKSFTHRVLCALRLPAGVMRRAVIVGTGTLGRRIFSALTRSPKLGMDPVAFVEITGPAAEAVIFESSYHRKRQARVLTEPVTAKLLRRLGASIVILAEPDLAAEEAAAIRAETDVAGATVCVIPEPFREASCVTEYVELDGVMLAYSAKRSERLLYEAAKRSLDIGVSLVSLLLMAPVLTAAALAVKVSSPGPVLFRQKRIGRLGREFEMLKFRSMHVDCPQYAVSPISGADHRITSIGRFLRHTCIDELPQLANVLRGDMSLVGPRPEMPFIVEQYESVHQQRLAVKPGITGLWQLSADRASPIHENISYDLYYVQHRSLWMDMAILLHTVVFAFRGV